MNKNDRKQMNEHVELIEAALQVIREIGEAEQEKFDNLTEGLQASERGQEFEETAQNIEMAADNLQSALEELDDYR